MSKQLPTDLNAVIAGYLHDLAAMQTMRQKQRAYGRAASAILNLDRQIDAIVADRTDATPLDIPLVGPSSLRVIQDVLETGASPTVDRALAASARPIDIAERRRWRQHFLSRAAVLAVLSDRATGGPRRADYHGDLQMHSTSSDGRQSLVDIVTAGLARGYTFSAVTDHSHGLPIARGMSMETAARQHGDIDAINRETGGRFRLIKGVEANLLSDGSLDLSAAELQRFELVVAAPHAALRGTEDQTGRMLRAVMTPGVHILGHPRGRKYGTRPGVTADWDRVFDAAARTGVAIELDGDPSRQDLDFTLAARAVAAGCLFALDSDAHATDELDYIDIALAHARLANVPRHRIINCWTTERLLAWAEDRRRARP